MYTLRERIEEVVFNHHDHVTKSEVDDIMQIIENHITWSSASTCRFAHVFSDCGAYEIDSTNTVYYNDDMIAARHTLDEAKQAAQKHKEGQV